MTERNFSFLLVGGGGGSWFLVFRPRGFGYRNVILLTKCDCVFCHVAAPLSTTKTPGTFRRNPTPAWMKWLNSTRTSHPTTGMWKAFDFKCTPGIKKRSTTYYWACAHAHFTRRSGTCLTWKNLPKGGFLLGAKCRARDFFVLSWVPSNATKQKSIQL